MELGEEVEVEAVGVVEEEEVGDKVEEVQLLDCGRSAVRRRLL